MLDTTKGVKATLLERERVNSVRMAQELVSIRYRKIAKMIVAGQKVPFDALASEEQALYNGIAPSGDAFSKFREGLLGGQLVKIHAELSASPSEPPVVHSRVTLRFLKPVPSIIGGDMKSYGPFLVEDVASVPVENARILIKQGLAKAIELQ
jgi:DNA replication initiation complex subunit (GINS family)